MAISLPDARQLSDDLLQALRLRALHGWERGFTEAAVADILGLSRETVSSWWSAYSSQGLDALPQERSGRPLGSGRLLFNEQANHLQDSSITTAPKTWASLLPCGTVAPCAI